MPSLREYKVGFKCATLAFMAGGLEVCKALLEKKAYVASPEELKDLSKKYARSIRQYLRSSAGHQLLVDQLNEEAAYPMGDYWSAESTIPLTTMVKLPKGTGIVYREPVFRFKKGFAKSLDSITRHHYLERDEEADIAKSTIDHWLLLVINISFTAGAATMAQVLAASDKAAFECLSELEDESEPWGRYPQIIRMLDAELSRDEDGNDQEESSGKDYDDEYGEDGDTDDYGFDKDEDDLYSGYDDDDDGGREDW